MNEDQIMKTIRAAGFSEREQRVLTYTSWKDGIDIKRPTPALVVFVQRVESYQAAEIERLRDSIKQCEEATARDSARVLANGREET